MSLDLTFEQVCDFIKKDDSKSIDAVDKLLGLALMCSPIVLGPAAIVAVPPLITMKNEIVKIGHGLSDVIASKTDDNYLMKQQRMEIAYCLICFTAFFDALDQQIPINLRKKINLRKEKMISLAKSAQGKDLCESELPSSDLKVAIANSLTALSVSFPHPAETLAQQVKRNSELWEQMAESFRDYIQNLGIGKEAEEKEQKQIIIVKNQTL